MSMVVYKNLNAMNSHRYLKLNESNFSKSIERLSSGLKINRAADDPAGLVISEQFRSQVEGLNQAVRNANDGISLIQTAEAALDEATGLLRTMRNLALHAANTGASDPAAVAADQEQIESSIASLDRIANTTSFGTRKLLNGSSGVSGAADNPNITFMEGTTATVEGSYAVAVTTASEKGAHASGVAREGLQTIGSSAAGFASGAGVLAADSTLTITGEAVNGETIELSWDAAAAQADIKTDIVSALNDAGVDWIDAADVTVTLDAVAGNSELTIDNLNVLGDEHADALSLAGTGDFAAAVWEDTAAAAVDSNTYLGQDETVLFKDGDGSYVSVALQQGDTIGEAVSRMNDALDDAGFKITAAWDDTNDVFTLTNDEYGASDVVEYTVASNVVDGNALAGTGLQIGAVANSDQTIADGAGLAAAANAGVNVAGSIGGNAATSSDGVYLTAAAGTDAEGVKVKIAGGTTPNGNVTVDQNSLEFQIGAFSDQQVRIGLFDLRTNDLGKTATGTTSMSTVDVANLDLTTEEGAQDAIKVIDAAIDEISSMRSELGSFQKDILESSVRSLRVAAQNIAATESVIRDADMAEEMLNFSKAQILQSTGMAMLAQANQAPQSIMRLFG